jgi:cyclophilin family peptidyl-prolyl cis-trans isomerase
MRRVAAVLTGVMLLWGAAVARANTVGPIVEFQTTLGNIFVQLFQNDAPNTVANFEYYMNKGYYNGTFFHRSAKNFVIQAGGYGYTNGALTQVPPQAPVNNEFKDSNVRGTLAMALVGSPPNPNSATDQFFFNLSDSNASSLDQLGTPGETPCSSSVTTNCYRPGFTVFGKVLGTTGLGVMDSIAAEPTANLNSALGQPSNGPFDTVPVINYTSGQPAQSNLVFITSVSLATSTTPPTVTVNTPSDGEQFDQGQVTLSDFSCSDGTGPGIQSCTAPTMVDTSRLGTHTFTVVATDFGGLTTTKVVHYVVDPVPPPPHEHHPPPVTFPKPTQLQRGGIVVVTMRCGAAGGCHGTLTLAAGKRHSPVGLIDVSMYNGQTRKLKLKLNPKGRRMLHPGAGRVNVWLTIRLQGHATTTRRLSLKT